MPQVIQGYLVNTKPSDTTAESTYVADTIAAGAAATTIHYPSQYRSYAISAAIKIKMEQMLDFFHKRSAPYFIKCWC